MQGFVRAVLVAQAVPFIIQMGLSVVQATVRKGELFGVATLSVFAERTQTSQVAIVSRNCLVSQFMGFESNSGRFVCFFGKQGFLG